MNKKIEDTGIILVVLERSEKQRLPRFMGIKLKFDQGKTINEFDIEYISEAMHDARMLFPYMDRHPEYKPLIARVIHYYKLVIDDAVANEK